MIQIKHNRLSQISATYFRSIDKRIQERITDVELVRDSLYNLNGKSVLDFSSLKPKPWGSKRNILNSFPGVHIPSQSELTKWSATTIVNSYKPLVDGIIDYLKVRMNRRKIILASASDHEQEIKDHHANMGIHSSNEVFLKPLLAIILDYRLITRKIAYTLTWGLNIRTCPYCNRIWIDTVRDTDGGIIRPTLDHFYSQEGYPLLGLSFYNLIPSCYYCNTYLKSVKDFSTTTHAHPYIEGFDQDALFSFSFKGLKPDISHPSNFAIKFKMKPKIAADVQLRIFGDKRKDIGNIPTFKLQKIYQTHRDLLGELYLKTEEVSPFYVITIKEFLTELHTSKEEFYRFHFHNYYEDESMNMRPLSKFTKDIVLERISELR